MFFHFCCGLLHNILYTCLLNEQQELGQTKTKVMNLIFTGSNLATSVILLLLILLMLKINLPLELGENLFGERLHVVSTCLNWWISFRFQNSPPQSRPSVRNNSPNTKKRVFKEKQKYCVALKLATSSIKFGWSHVVPKKYLPNMKPLNNLPNITLTQPALRVFNNPRCFSGIWNMHREKCVAGYAISASSATFFFRETFRLKLWIEFAKKCG